MREKPILFSGPMVQAILDGRKTMTRRVVKPQPEGQLECVIRHEVSGRACWMVPGADQMAKDFRFHTSYEVGTKLWVREAWAANIPGCPNGITYKADHIDPKGDGPANPIKWKPSIHMPKAAARIWLEVVNVRVERLQGITEEDAIKEGFEGFPCDHPIGRYACEDCMNSGWREPPSLEFMETWQSLNDKRGYGWDVNPWVWVVEFKRLEVD